MKKLSDWLRENKFEYKGKSFEMYLERYQENMYKLLVMDDISKQIYGNQTMEDCDIIEPAKGYDIGDIIADLFEAYGEEIRFCEECGAPMTQGFTTDYGDGYCCEDCFEESMNECYGKGYWRESKDENSCYEYLEDGEWEPSPIYWTSWND